MGGDGAVASWMVGEILCTSAARLPKCQQGVEHRSRMVGTEWYDSSDVAWCYMSGGQGREDGKKVQKIITMSLN